MGSSEAGRDGRPIRLVAVGVWLPGSGFTRVLENVLTRLAPSFDAHLLGIGYRGPVRDFGGATLHPTNLEGGDVFAAIRAAELVEELDARIVLLLNDLWMIQIYMRTLPRVRDRAAIVAYVPVDGRIVDAQLLEPLGGVDRFVAFTCFGKEQIEAFSGAVVEVIPHGIDTETFRPLPGGRAEARRRLFPDEPDWYDAFIVLNANRPLERKRIDLTLEGFARFARSKPAAVKLWLHHAIMDADEHRRIAGLGERLGIGDRLRVSPLGAPPLADEELNLVYNACEVGVNTAMGEGWGLVSFEHAATGAAQIVAGSSACAELWAGSAEVVEAEETGVPTFSPLALRTVSATGVADALERLYADPDHLRRMSAAAYDNATLPCYGWDEIGTQWRRVLRNLVTARQAA